MNDCLKLTAFQNSCSAKGEGEGETIIHLAAAHSSLGSPLGSLDKEQMHRKTTEKYT